MLGISQILHETHLTLRTRIFNQFAHLKFKSECPLFAFAKSGTSVPEWRHAGKFQAAPGSKLCAQRSCHGSLSTPSQALGSTLYLRLLFPLTPALCAPNTLCYSAAFSFPLALAAFRLGFCTSRALAPFLPLAWLIPVDLQFSQLLLPEGFRICP